ncbi:TadA family conjugal transfer-associated ATPase [Nocardioides houyundeii]|uniref:TadA family conjugal transfer-associated ATPase n=1 Tax=Nocardioides houyundeii TaxID=2045452 RepID=UPI000C7883E3|nr:TadA family conjugal transfer-associated ATPase [Nocardioides houyundeii]
MITGGVAQTPGPPPELVEAVRDQLAREHGEVTPHRVAEVLRSRGLPLGAEEVRAVHAVLRSTAFGVGVLEPLMGDREVTDVLVNGPGPVWVDRGDGLEQTEVVLGSEEEVRRLAQRLAGLGGRRLDDATPCCDVRLPDGTRFHAVLAPVARPGTLVSLRVPRARAFGLEDLVAAGTLTGPGARLLRDVVTGRLAYLISGGTGSGKTTLLATMLGLVPPQERIVLVEDSSELRPVHPHVVALEARPPNIEGKGGLDLRTLVRQALRMRPDRLVVGEVRGAEVVDLLAAMNTGHEGGAGTLHANSATQVPARIEALAATAGLGRAAAASQLAAAVDLVLHVVRGRDGVRRLAQVALPSPTSEGDRIRCALEFTADGRLVEGPAADDLARRLG